MGIKSSTELEFICEKLSDRSAVLFIGAGINSGIVNDKGMSFPLGKQLSTRLAEDVLGDPKLEATLDEVAEMAKYKIGERELNRYLFELLTSFEPGKAHSLIIQFPWDVIFTTNYDLLLEEAAKHSLSAAGKICPIFSDQKDLVDFKEEDILYYKLHGSIDIANTAEGKLILTKEDYRYYLEKRRPLFKRLKSDLLSRTFIFIGYSLRDQNFREILEDCREALGATSFPSSFAIRDKVSPGEKGFWKEKYNISLIEDDGANFLSKLKEAWEAGGAIITPLEERRKRDYVQIDTTARFQRIGDVFYLVNPGYCGGEPKAELFFRGAEPTWADIRAEVAPKRDLYWTLFEGIFPELADPESPPSVFLVTGFAGTGKTTLLLTLAFELANDYKIPVLVHIPGTPLDASAIGPLVERETPKRIVVIIKYAAEYISQIQKFFDEAQKQKLPLTIILEERKNQWISAVANKKISLHEAEFDLGSLSPSEINDILDSLARFNLLGKLTDLDRKEQIEHFSSLADKELLVALRELTTGSSFDEIIKDEFNKIPNNIAQRAYVYVSVISQLDLAIRYETLTRALGLRFDQLNKLVFAPTEGILISTEEVGFSRHNLGYRIRTRHPVIASIIFSECAPTDNKKFEIIDSILASLDPGFPEDQRMLRELTKKRELINTLEYPENKRAVYDRLRAIMPDNPHILQHRSILERELGNPDLAVRYAREAVKYDNKNQELLNTLGMALEFSARSETDLLKWKMFIKEADKIFQENVRVNPKDPFGYIGKISLIRQRFNREADVEKKDAYASELMCFLDEAYEKTDESPIIAAENAKQQELVGEVSQAIAILEKAVAKKPEDSRLRCILVRLQMSGSPDKALATSLEGLKYAPNSWRLNRYAARLKRQRNDSLDSIMGYYESAFRNNRGDISLLVEYASFLFINNKRPRANELFDLAKSLPIPGFEKKKRREYWEESRRKKLFNAVVSETISSGCYVLTIPDNITAFFYRSNRFLSKLKKGDRVKCYIGFNAWGPYAEIVE